MFSANLEFSLSCLCYLVSSTLSSFGVSSKLSTADSYTA
nr:MAG TPA: hypothetical protein [Crassvirales sp.]